MKKYNKLYAKSETLISRPEFFRMPQKGGDPYFGLSRSYYYNLEVQGRLQLVRLRSRGNLRGVTLIPYGKVAGLINLQREENL
jgi:hypothetical protein